VATLRNARGTAYPEPVFAALCAEYAGANSIVVHVREDRRHIKERDAFLIKQVVKIPLNLEMSANKDIVSLALLLKPSQATLVPERRQELTTEGGIDLVKNYKKIEGVTKELQRKGITVSLFIDPLKIQIKKAKEIGAENIEINTGKYSEAKSSGAQKKELKKIKAAAACAKDLGFFVAAGHGLDYENVTEITRIKEIEELNIGHAIVCRSLFVGFALAVEEMLGLMKR